MTSETDPLIAATIGGRWLVQRKLSAGGMGAVYVAHHTNTGRPVAVKVIKSEEAVKPDFIARFKKETAALASISHPNVVNFLDSGIENGALFLVMELLSGRELRREMNRAIPWERAFRIAADCCRGLAAVHRAGLIHRDLKPENIFLQDSDGHADFAKLIDFGIVRIEDGHDPNAATKSSAIVGTPGYISPEQLQGKPATQVSDIYAIGVILYEMVTGNFPFAATNPQAMLVRQLIDPVTPMRAFVSALPPGVEALIARMMDRDPQQRPQTAQEALKALTELASASSPALAQPSLPSTAQTEPTGLTPPPASLVTPQPPATVVRIPTQTAETGKVDVPKSKRAPMAAAALVLSSLVAILAVTQPWKEQKKETEKKQETSTSSVLGSSATAFAALPPPPGMIAVPAGTYRVGPEGAERPVVLKAFAIDQFEVSIAESRAAVQSSNDARLKDVKIPLLPPAFDDLPLVSVTQQQAQALCAARGARLPTDEEWEAAARGEGHAYPWGNGWRAECVNAGGAMRLAGRAAHACGRTSTGIAHLAGNAAEWTSSTDPAGATVVRGGHIESAPDQVTTSSRATSRDASPFIGFRCARDL